MSLGHSSRCCVMQASAADSGPPLPRWSCRQRSAPTPNCCYARVKPLQRLDRLEAVGEGVAEMSREEASYWHAQTQRRHGLKALRVLLSMERGHEPDSD